MRAEGFAGLAILLLAASGCVSQQAVHSDNYANRTNLNVSSFAMEIHSLVNGERAKAGLPPLAWDDRLAQIAINHSSDMVARQYFGHYTPEGKSPNDRALLAGYNCTRVINETETALPGGRIAIETTYAVGIGENLAKNNLYDYTLYEGGVAYYYNWNTQDQIARSTVSGWMNSTEHRDNILQAHYTQEGIGVVVSPDDGVYVTENFC